MKIINNFKTKFGKELQYILIILNKILKINDYFPFYYFISKYQNINKIQEE